MASDLQKSPTIPHMAEYGTRSVPLGEEARSRRALLRRTVARRSPPHGKSSAPLRTLRAQHSRIDAQRRSERAQHEVARALRRQPVEPELALDAEPVDQ